MTVSAAVHRLLPPPLPGGGARQATSLRERYSVYLSKRGRTPATVENALSALSVFEQFCRLSGSNPLFATEGDIVYFVQWLQRRGCKRATVRNRIVNLKSFFGFLVSEGLRADNPAANVKVPPARETLVRPYSAAELSVFFLELRKTRKYKRNTAICALLLATGWRSSEVRQLRVEDIDFDSGIISLGAEAKGGKHLRAAPEDAAMDALRDHLRSAKITSGWVFPGRNGAPMSRHGLYDMVRDTAQKAGLKFNVHRFRHTFGPVFLDGGGDILELMHLFGHSKIDTTRRYVDYSTQQRALRKQRSLHSVSQVLPRQNSGHTTDPLVASESSSPEDNLRTSYESPSQPRVDIGDGQGPGPTGEAISTSRTRVDERQLKLL